MSSHRVEPFPTDMSNPCLKAFINSTQDPYVVKQSLTLPRSGHIQAQNAGDSMQWRSSHQSECETVLDSGYGSVPGYPFDTASMISQPVGDHGRDVRDLAGEFANPNDFRGVGSGFINNWQGMQSHPNSKGLFRCSHPGCKNPFCKTRSELNKHKRRHEKPFKCSVPSCQRAHEGFSTPNDRDRHSRSVHNASGVRYRCNHDGCRAKHKLWPRADNFKAHLVRSHHLTVPIDELSPYLVRSDDANPLKSMHDNPTVPGSKPDFETDEPPQATFEPGAGISPEKINDGDDDIVLEGYDAQCLMGPSLTLSRVSTDSSELNGQGSFSMANVTFGTLFQPSRRSLQPSTSQGAQEEIGNVTVRENTIQSSHSDSFQATSSRPKMEEASHTAICEDGDGKTAASKTPAPEDCPHERYPLSSPSHDRDGSSHSAASHASGQHSLSGEEILKDTQSLFYPPVEAVLSVKNYSQKQIDIILEELQAAGELETRGFFRSLSPSENTRVSKASASQQARRTIPCPECNKVFSRPCDLSKHKKRHEKPYACSFSKCGKKFGSNNDLKRHENTQHCQFERWKYDSGASQAPDYFIRNKVSNHQNKFWLHVQDAHCPDFPGLEHHLCGSRTGRNSDGIFRYRFCHRRTLLENVGREGRNERVDHMDHDFLGESGWKKRAQSEWEAIDVAEKTLDGSTMPGRLGCVSSRSPCQPRTRERPPDDESSEDSKNTPKRACHEQNAHQVNGD